MHGALLIDKPKDITSFDVIRALRKRFPKVKMGHLGTLDPLATGLLPIFVGTATRLIRYFNECDKTYEAVIELGKSSDTFDADGKITNHTVLDSPTDATVRQALSRFLGPQLQIQPAFSAIKRHGKPAYKNARGGNPVTLGKRQVSILDIRNIQYHYPVISFTVDCSAGTYIRSLAHELGQSLGTGAILRELRRTVVGPFQLQDAIRIDAVRVDHLILPFSLIMDFIPSYGPCKTPLRELLATRCAVRRDGRAASARGFAKGGSPVPREKGFCRVHDHRLKPKEKAFLVNCFSETRLQKKGGSA